MNHSESWEFLPRERCEHLARITKRITAILNKNTRTPAEESVVLLSVCAAFFDAAPDKFRDELIAGFGESLAKLVKLCPPDDKTSLHS